MADGDVEREVENRGDQLTALVELELSLGERGNGDCISMKWVLLRFFFLEEAYVWVQPISFFFLFDWHATKSQCRQMKISLRAM